MTEKRTEGTGFTHSFKEEGVLMNSYDTFTRRVSQKKEQVFVQGNSEEFAGQVANQCLSIRRTGEKVVKAYLEKREAEKVAETVRIAEVARLQKYQKDNPIERVITEGCIKTVSDKMVAEVVPVYRQRVAYIAKGMNVKMPKMKRLNMLMQNSLNDIDYISKLSKLAVFSWVPRGTTDTRKRAVISGEDYSAWKTFKQQDKEDILQNTLLSFLDHEQQAKVIQRIHFLIGGNPKEATFRTVFAGFFRNALKFKAGEFARHSSGILYYGELKHGIQFGRKVNVFNDYTVNFMLENTDRKEKVLKHMQTLELTGVAGKRKALNVYNVFNLLAEGYKKVEIAKVLNVSEMQVYRLTGEIVKALTE